MTNSPQDSFFIDMKYIVLYRKLGFREVKPDVFTQKYGAAEICIEAESQRFMFNGAWHQLLTYKDMVNLECVDRLLKKGYKPESIVFDDGFNLMLQKDGKIFTAFLFDEWGKKYNNLVSEFAYDGGKIILYTSQLAGGLIEYKSKIYTTKGVFDGGFFDKVAKLYPLEFYSADDNEIDGSSDFVIKGVELIKYTGSASVVSVPSGIKRIGTGAFWSNMTVKSIILPEGLLCIAGDAFVYCENLNSITIPKSVEVIGDNPFAGCSKLIVKNLSKEFVLEDGVLFDKTKRSLIHYTPSKVDAEYIIPESVEWIGKHSFYKCNILKRVVISKNVSYMGNNAFSDCTNVTLKNHSPHFRYIDAVLYNGDLTLVYHYSLGSGVTDVRLQRGVRTIGRNSFWNARKIEKIAIPESVRQIGYNPFAYCISAEFVVQSQNYAVFNGALYTADFRELVCCTAKVIQNGTIKLHDGLESIGRNAFVGCETIEWVVLPSSVKSIARWAFSGCKNLKEIRVRQDIEYIDKLAFDNCAAEVIKY